MPKRRRPIVRPPVEWDFWSFPTFMAFSVGLFAGTILAFSGLGSILALVSMFAVTFSLVHVATHWFMRRRQKGVRSRAEEEERERRALAARAASTDDSGDDAARRRRRRRR